MKRKLTALITAFIISASMLTTACSGDGQSSSGSGSGGILPGTVPGTNAPMTEADKNVKITAGEWTNIEWTPYSHQYVTLQIPKGWTVEVTDLYQGGQTGSGTLVVVRNPSSTVCLSYMDFATIYSSLMKETTIESFFRDTVAGNSNGEIMNFTTTSKFQSESQKAFAQANSAVLDAGVLTGDWKSKKLNMDMEGIYSGCVESSLGMYGMYTIVSPISMDVPKGTLANWNDVLTKIMSSIQWTSACTARYQAGSVISSGGSSGGDSSPIMEAWENRNKSEDIMSQKRSDATLGHERVQDTYTGDIYMANNGFYQQYSTSGGQRYVPITDDMYTQGYVGYLSY